MSNIPLDTNIHIAERHDKKNRIAFYAVIAAYLSPGIGDDSYLYGFHHHMS